MDYFEEQEAKEKERLEEQKYQELYQKQTKISRVALLAVFLPMGLIFVVSGIGFLLGSSEEDLETAFVFLGCGVFFVVLGLVLYFAIPKKGNYQRYKSNVEKRGGLNLFDLSIRVGFLDERVKKLELENQELTKRIEDMERNHR
ncbi:MAG: Got1/Sft2-like family vesicle transport protein [Anaeroplasmataceae bacterium]|nr:Got1/Sft2-like family vesicle transport protein [Anaeroplasmataceae bacterium]MDE6241311.1 Got1/Sft2-like family vesicle transport protein [Anaeroplasmataceae bacterium]